MRENFDASLAAVLAHEGGYVDDPRDPGGATNMGITQGTLSDWRGYQVTKQEVRDLTVEEAGQIYKANYWDKIRADELPGGVDYATFDFGVNSGTSRAVKFLQRILGTDQDGVVGPITLKAAWQVPPEDTVNRLCDDRMAWLRTLHHWPTYGRGWTNRVEGGGGHVGVRPLALEMAERAPELPPQPEPDPAPEPPADSIAEALGQASDAQLIAELMGRKAIQSWITLKPS